jgi:hypothetical protein
LTFENHYSSIQKGEGEEIQRDEAEEKKRKCYSKEKVRRKGK